MKFFLDNVEENNNTLFCYLVIFDTYLHFLCQKEKSQYYTKATTQQIFSSGK